MVKVGFAIVGITALLMWTAGCATPRHGDASSLSTQPELGHAARLEPITAYRHLTLRLLFRLQGLSEISTDRGIDLYRITYWSRSAQGETVPASGLLALPRGPHAPKGLVSWQHGTATLREAAPSTPDAYNGLVAAAVFAGHGYAVFAPDYLGFGASREPHSYYNTQTIEDAVVFGLHAAREALAELGLGWPSPRYLVGFSQGGHASLAALRALENEPDLRPHAVASVAGPVDLAGIGFSNALTGRSKFSVLYIAWIALTYARDYGHELNTLVREPWSSKLSDLFNGTHSGAEILAALPEDPKVLLQPVVLRALENSEPHWFIERLEENGLVGWVPPVPVRMYYGDDDVSVLPAHAKLLEKTTNRVQAVSVGPANHDESILLAVPLLRAWFDELTAGAREPADPERRE